MNSQQSNDAIKESNSQVPLVENGAALQSMRSSDFDAYSAYGEVIDNAIQANAKNIKIQFQYEKVARNREPITSITFVDDGDGMGSDILHRCLQLGYSSRYNDRNGIGRFGVGATLAAINQCQKVEIFSKQKGGVWLYTYVDLEEITNGNMLGIPTPIPKDPTSEELAKSAKIAQNHGTIVVWGKYDRQPDDANVIIEEFIVWTGRTYRKFIWEGLEISINGTIVPAIDPLYATTNKTAFPDDTPATLYKEMELPWPIPEEDKIPGGPISSTIKIKMSLLPLELRPQQGAGNLNETKKRSIHYNEGISITRNGREVFYGHVPYWPRGPFKEIDRWWGCEVAFDAILDKEFTVKNIKRGAVPVKELKKALSDLIEPTRRTAVETVQNEWRTNAASATVTPNGPSTKTGHEGAEKVVKATVTPKNQIDKEKDSDEETRRFVNNWLVDADAQTKSAWEAKFKSQPFSIIQDSWRGADFFETAHLGGQSVLKYNTQHSFFIEINDIINRLESSEDDTEDAKSLKILIDLLLLSFSKAEASFDANDTVTVSEFMDQLKISWGNFMSTYLKTFKNENS